MLIDSNDKLLVGEELSFKEATVLFRNFIKDRDIYYTQILQKKHYMKNKC